MRFASIATTLALSFIGLCQALPMIESRAATSAHQLKSVTYSPFNPDGTCKTASQITSAIKTMKSVGFKNIRTYQQNCNQLDTILKAIHSDGGGMTVLAGVRISNTPTDDVEMATLKAVLNKKQNTQYIKGILVGNEVVFGKIMSSSALVQKINAVRAFAKGYKVGTVEIYTTYTQDLIDVSDMISLNLHPYFAQVDIKDALITLNSQYTSFKKLTKKPILITETGWPSGGDLYGKAQPSVANEKYYAIQLAKSNLPYYFFNWQDSGNNPGFMGVETHWGLQYSNGKFKFDLKALK